MADKAIEAAAAAIRKAWDTGTACPPVRDSLPANDVNAAYAVQKINTDKWVAEGRRLSGRKIGLTAKAVQKQLGVDQPDYGMLFADMCYVDGEEMPVARLMQPPIEVVGSRIAKWDIKIVDTIADNASSGLFVLGTRPVKLDAVDLRLCGMVMENKGDQVSVGAGVACLGNPLTAALWLARKMVEVGQPLRAGDVIMTGALGPMAPVVPGDVLEARISGLGSVRAAFAKE